MKRVLILIMLLLVVSLVSAEEVLSEEVISGPMLFDLEDFSVEPVQAIKVSKGDQMFFEMFDAKHALFIKDLIKDNIKITFFPNITEGQGAKGAGSLPIKEGKLLAVDVNKDDHMDLTVHLYEINGDDAVIIIRDVRDFDQETEVPEGAGLVTYGPDVPTGFVPKEPESNNKNIFLVLAFIVVVLFGILLGKKRRQKSEEESFE